VPSSRKSLLEWAGNPTKLIKSYFLLGTVSEPAHGIQKIRAARRGEPCRTEGISGQAAGTNDVGTLNKG